MHPLTFVRPTFFNAPNLKKSRGYIVLFFFFLGGGVLGGGEGCLLVCLSVHLCVGYACTRSITIGNRILEFNIWNSYANKMTIFFAFSLHLEFQSYSPLFIVLIFPL